MTDEQRPGLRQPLLGVAAFAITVGLSLGVCALVTPATLGSWVALFFISAVPAMVVLDIGLRLEYPAFLRKARQPAKGLIFVALVVSVSAVVSPLVLYGIGGGVTPPAAVKVMLPLGCKVKYPQRQTTPASSARINGMSHQCGSPRLPAANPIQTPPPISQARFKKRANQPFNAAVSCSRLSDFNVLEFICVVLSSY